MSTSERRLAANRANAQLSTGPRTEEGKAASRANALKHGLSSLVVVPGEEQGLVAARVECLQESLAPDDDPLTLVLARQFAFLSVQLERGYRYDEAMAADRARTAPEDSADARLAAAEHLYRTIGIDPITNRRRLMSSIEGVDLLIRKMEELDRVGRPGRSMWLTDHGIALDMYSGDHPGTTPQSRASALSDLIERDDARFLDPNEIPPGLDRFGKIAWATAELHKLVAIQLDRLRAHRATLDPDKHAVSRAQSPSRALFGAEKEALLYRRYQMAAMRALLKFGEQIRTRRHDLERGHRKGLPPGELAAATGKARTLPEVPAPGPGLASFCALLEAPLAPIDASKFAIGKSPITPTLAPKSDPRPPRYTP